MTYYKKLQSKPIEWYLIGTAGLLLEYAAIQRKNKRTASRVIWAMRSDKIGKWLLISCWAWFTYHFFFESAKDD